MYKPFYTFIGARYAHIKRKNHFISFISMTSMLGIALGVLVLITVISVMNGFSKEIKAKMLSITPHITVYAKDGLVDWANKIQLFKKYPTVLGVAPFTQHFGMVVQGANVEAIEIKGIDAKHINDVFPISKNMITGKVSSLEEAAYNVIIGAALADQLGVWEGDKITLIIPKATVSLAGVMPRMKRVTVTGIFNSGTLYDKKTVFININDAGKLFSLHKSITGLQIKLVDPGDSPEVMQQLKQDFAKKYTFTDWCESYGDFFAAIKMEKTVMWCILVLIVAVAAFNLVSSLVMMVTDKKTDIAILRTMGASRKSIMAIFIFQGSIIGLVGTLLGLVLGLVLASNITLIVECIQELFNVRFISADVYYISYVPSAVQFLDVFFICIISLVMSLVATIYPAFRAASISPAEALRYE
jgi:lipoprotein-releasing system permease protein